MTTVNLPLEFLSDVVLVTKESFPQSKVLRLGSKICEHDGIIVSFKTDSVYIGSVTEFYAVFVPEFDETLSIAAQWHDYLSYKDDWRSLVYCYPDFKLWRDEQQRPIDRPVLSGVELEVIAEKLLPVFQRCF